jgi:hypothetical protein
MAKVSAIKAKLGQQNLEMAKVALIAKLYQRFLGLTHVGIELTRYRGRSVERIYG